MSKFDVTLQTVKDIRPHSNADRLELAKIGSSDYQFVVPKGQLHEGQFVIHFPLDSIMPAEILDKIGLTGKLSGKDRNIVKTVKLRGEISQGLIIPMEDLLPIEWCLDYNPGASYMSTLGVTKYDPPPVIIKQGNLVRLPEHNRVYDIENAENYPEVVAALMNKECIVTEKLEGTHFSATLNAEDEFFVCQRRYAIQVEEGQSHLWHQMADKYHLHRSLKEIRQHFSALDTITIRGELVGPGIQKNIYGLKEHQVFFFELEVNGSPVGWDNFWEYCWWEELPVVPVIDEGRELNVFLRGTTLVEVSHGPSKLNESVQREGIIIKPVEEMKPMPEVGRVFIKQKDPQYLADF